MSPVDSREIDALVAVKVMGANKFEGQFIEKVDHETNTVTIGTEWRYPAYSTDIEAAWEVVEKQYPLIGLRPSGRGKWTAFCIAHDEEVEAESAPMAICKAALAGVERAEAYAKNHGLESEGSSG